MRNPEKIRTLWEQFSKIQISNINKDESEKCKEKYLYSIVGERESERASESESERERERERKGERDSESGSESGSESAKRQKHSTLQKLELELQIYLSRS